MLVFLFPVDIHQLSIIKKEVSPDNWSPRLDHKDLKLPQIKKEQEEADIIAFTFSPASVYSEDDEEKPQSSERHLNHTEEITDFAGPKPDLDSCLESNHEDKTSDASEDDVSDGDRRRENSKTFTAALIVVKQSTTGCIC